MSPILLIILFIASAIVGYIIIRNIPALIHTPLMSGMNALSGVTVLGAIIASFASKGIIALLLALLAALLAIINVVGGFTLTHKMLRSFVKKGAQTKYE